MDPINITAYVLLLAAIIKVYYVENKDTQCPYLSAPQNVCDERGGMSYADSKPDPSDSCDVLIKKIRKAAGAETDSIKWRKNFVIASVGMILIWTLIITPGELPNWVTMFVSIIVLYALLFNVSNWYSFHVYARPESWINESLDLLKKNCKT